MATSPPSGTSALLRWYVSSATFAVPQAAGPVAYALVAVALTGETSGGAAMILAFTLAQVAGAIPLTRLGRGLAPTTYLRLLVLFRAAALGAVALLAYNAAPFIWLVVFSALAGSVTGSAFGYLRAVLSELAPAGKLPRALGIASTLNEVTFVLAPVLASGLGTDSPAFAVIALAALGSIPALLVPTVPSAPTEAVHAPDTSVMTPSILLWLTCAAAGGSTVAALEIGAVGLALQFGYPPALAILFTVPLCVASVAGGIWVSVRNRMASRRAVLIQLIVMAVGAIVVALQLSMATTVAGAILVGAVLAPLGTYYSLILDALAPPRKRPEVFALLRTANATGIIIASAVMTAVSLSTALIVVSCLMSAVVILVGLAPRAPMSKPPAV